MKEEITVEETINLFSDIKTGYCFNPDKLPLNVKELFEKIDNEVDENGNGLIECLL